MVGGKTPPKYGRKNIGGSDETHQMVDVLRTDGAPQMVQV